MVSSPVLISLLLLVGCGPGPALDKTKVARTEVDVRYLGYAVTDWVSENRKAPAEGIELSLPDPIRCEELSQLLSPTYMKEVPCHDR